ncbi:ABC-type Fe3+-siderophore transport system permease component [Paramagnetospirillum magnetotacticum MS-1]|uniref:ABC-type Fe3+-siderophore transport system permease component n=1 Tax=Paramagnetospirillum magnetotacticum MS-1 TaxID=272627 RepID=A0A0C2YRZ4_PARME|nr:hypothetical protein [Paramagnetospirillum magnetotacticum]KIL97475.1 ABC-type Fe3+-siderophore transport system permease component [Paramagnetospirillum magnetotacticum MS-1]
MFFGRVMGWLLIGVAVIMASADAVLALGPAEYASIVTADVVTLISGHAPDTTDAGRSAFSAFAATVLDMPAWIAVGLMGLGLSIACRQRQRQRRFVFRR